MAKSTKRRKTQSKTTKTESNQERPTHKTKQRTPTQPTQTNNKGGKGQVLKNLTRLWPGSSSTLTRNKRNKPKNRTNPQIDTRQPNKVAHTAVREKGAIRGEGKGNNKLEALTVFSQKIQAQE